MKRYNKKAIELILKNSKSVDKNVYYFTTDIVNYKIASIKDNKAKIVYTYYSEYGCKTSYIIASITKLNLAESYLKYSLEITNLIKKHEDGMNRIFKNSEDCIKEEPDVLITKRKYRHGYGENN